MSRKIAAIPTDYADWLADIKARVATARQRAALAANAELIQLYWQIGRDILERQQSAQWGDKVLDRLSSDLREAFPGYERLFIPQPEIYEVFRRALSFAGIWAAACCPITLVPHCHAADQATHGRHPRMVCPKSRRRGLVARHAGTPDPQPPARAARTGRHQF
jgi:hypothetical protein